MPQQTMNDVNASTGTAARLWTKGTFAVRIMCTMSVCESSPSMNQPDWNSACRCGLLAPKTYHSITNVATSKIELMGPMKNMNRPMSSAFQRRGFVTYSGSIVSHGIDSCE